MTRQKAIKMLEAHGFAPDAPTAGWPSKRGETVWMVMDPTSTFDQEVGIRDQYALREVRDWLGY